MKALFNSRIAYTAFLFMFLANPQFTSAQSRGWFSEIMPEGLSRGENRGEYISAKSGEVMVYIPGGTSRTPQGSVSPKAEDVNIPAFYISKYEVTVKLYKRFTTETGYKTEAEKRGKAFIFDPSKGDKGDIETPGVNFMNPGFRQDERHPAVFLTWEDAKAYCDWAGGNLPNLSQWLKAALWDEDKSALRNRPWQKPGEPNDLLNVSYLKESDPLPQSAANFDKANVRDVVFGKAAGAAHGVIMSCNDQYVYTAPVGSYPSGQSYYHVHDMIGNVSEFFAERNIPWYKGPISTSAIGGSWRDIITIQGLYPLPLVPSNWQDIVARNLPVVPSAPGGWPYVGFRMAIPATK